MKRVGDRGKTRVREEWIPEDGGVNRERISHVGIRRETNHRPGFNSSTKDAKDCRPVGPSPVMKWGGGGAHRAPALAPPAALEV